MLNPRNGKKLELFKTSAQLVTNMAPDSTNPPTSYTPLWWSPCHPSWNPYSPDVEQNKKIFRVYVDSTLQCIVEKGLFVEQEDHLSIGIHIHIVCVVEQEDHLSAIVGQAMDYLIYSCINLIEDST